MPKNIHKNLDCSERGEETIERNAEYVPVNKGHFDMDTEERTRLFHQYLAQGWVEEYNEYRDAWENLPRQKVIRDFPIQVDLELASSCNLSCPMCYTTTDHFKETVQAKLMDYKLYQKIIDEVAGKVYAVRLSWRGESTLHINFIDAIRYAKDSGVKEVSFLTSGWQLTLDYFEKIAEAGADWITVSFDGLGEDYNKIRKPLIFEETLQKLKDIKDYKKSRGLTKPVIKVQGIWPAIRNHPEKFYDTLAPVSDLVAFNPLIDYLGNDEDIVYEEGFSCPQLYERIFVSSTGEVMMCNSDEYGEQVIGNACDQTIHQIWHGSALSQVRELHKKRNGFLEMDICSKCFFPRKTEVSEKIQINGREVLIENYINRSQEIGK